jgi:hypothetical protein
MFTLEQRSSTWGFLVEALPGFVEAHPGDREAHLRAIEAYPGAMKAQLTGLDLH